MALTIQENKDATVALVTADRRLWLDKSGQAVEDGDPTARVLFCTPGARIPRARAEEVGVKFKKAPATKKAASTKQTKES